MGGRSCHLGPTVPPGDHVFEQSRSGSFRTSATFSSNQLLPLTPSHLVLASSCIEPVPSVSSLLFFQKLLTLIFNSKDKGKIASSGFSRAFLHTGKILTQCPPAVLTHNANPRQKPSPHACPRAGERVEVRPRFPWCCRRCAAAYSRLTHSSSTLLSLIITEFVT